MIACGLELESHHLATVNEYDFGVCAEDNLVYIYISIAIHIQSSRKTEKEFFVFPIYRCVHDDPSSYIPLF